MTQMNTLQYIKPDEHNHVENLLDLQGKCFLCFFVQGTIFYHHHL